METQKRYLEGELFEWSHPLSVYYKLIWYDMKTIKKKRKEIKNKLNKLKQ